jgi:hypothetical protein
MTDTIPDLHSQIMNIHSRDDADLNAEYSDRRIAYKSGHRDARHAAAELAVDADQRIEALSAQVQALRADAGRYQWLKSLPDSRVHLRRMAVEGSKTLKHGFSAPHTVYVAKTIDEAIDAARAALQGESK